MKVFGYEPDMIISASADYDSISVISLPKIDWKPLIVCLLVTLVLGFVSGLIAGNAASKYEILNLPSVYPPAFVFPIVWTVLYILMSFSLYMVLKSKDSGDILPLAVFGFQLTVNFLWAPLFFLTDLYLASFILLVILWISVLAMIFIFWRINRKSAYLQIPYIVWLTIAAYLSYSVYVLN